MESDLRNKELSDSICQHPFNPIMVVRSELTINPPSHSVLNDSGTRVTKSAPVTMSRSGA